MSSSQSEQQKKNRKAFSKTLKSEIKRKPHTEPINGVEYTYGLLEKKSESSLFNNERFLIIKGHSTFGYASKLPDETLLPFLEESNIPKCKVEIPLEKLEFKNEKEILIVEFVEEGKKDKTRWEFTCGSKVKAIEWRQKLEGAKNEKISSSKNTAFKVILEDSKEQNEESENERPKTNQKNFINENESSPNELIKMEDERNKKTIKLEDEDKKMLQETDFNPFAEQSEKDVSQNKPSQALEKEVAGSHEKFPEVNIFESLIYSSPNKQPSKLFFETQQKINEKEFSDLKNQENSSMTTQPKKLQLEYQRLKREQETLQEELREENKSFFGPVLNTFVDKKYQLEKLKKEWGFEFAKGGNEYEIVESFRIYSEIVLTKIVDELSLEPKRRYYQPINESTISQRYEIDGVLFDIYFHTLREVASYEKRGSIISSYESKLAQKEFKNYDYILSLTANKGRIRVPLSMVVEYKGFICVAKVIIPEGESYENLDSLSKELGLLEAESKVSNSVFENGESGRIVPLNFKAYEKIARLQNSLSSSTTINKKFDICYVQSLINYLPQDFYYFNKLESSSNSNRGQNISALSPVHTLRKELIQDEEYDEVIFSGENMANVAQRLKIHPQMKEAIDVLINVSKSISERISAIVRSLESLEETVTNSKELAKLMHGYGVNMRYLGLVLERSRETWLRSIIISEIVSRCAKKFFHFSLQECITNLQETKPENTQKYQIKVAISFLNKLLGCSEETDQFWIQLSRQSQEDFRCFIDKRELNFGYLIQALESQCKIELTNVVEKKDSFFKTVEPLTVENFRCFVVKSKTYDLSFTELYTTVDQHLKEATQESFEQLSILLNLQRKSDLPSHFMLGDFHEKIILYMINWISPKDGHHFYYYEGQMGRTSEENPSRTLYETKLSEIKWILKEKKESEAERIRDWMIEHIHMWLGEYHPLLSELYDIFSRYYLSSKKEEKKAITYCKSSIKNFEKLLSRDNIKLADSYYMLAEVYINYDKKSEALGSLLRAREIMEQREGDDEGSEGYGMVVLRISQVMLSLQMVEDAIEEGRKAYSRLVEGREVEKLVESIELLGRCYEIGSRWDEYVEFIEIFITNHHDKLPLIAENSHLFERILKGVLLPYLRALTNVTHISGQLVHIIQSFSSLSSTTQSTYANSVSYLNHLIASNTTNIRFPLSFISTLQDDLEVLLDEIDSSGLMARWKGFETYNNNKNFTQKLNSLNNINPKLFEFLSQLETLTIILGESWFIGALNYF